MMRSRRNIPTAPVIDDVIERPGTPPPSYQEACKLDYVNDVYHLDSDENPCSSKRDGNRLQHNSPASGELNSLKPYPKLAAKQHPNYRRRVSRQQQGERHRSTSESSDSSHQTQEQYLPPAAYLTGDAYRKALAEMEVGLIPRLNFREMCHAIADFRLQRSYFSSRNASYTVSEVKVFCIWNYQVQTITERRFRTIEVKPYNGPRRASNQNETLVTSSEWDYEVEIPANYSGQTIRIPDSSSIITCDCCSGEGEFRCYRCRGEGEHACDRCFSSGHISIPDTSRQNSSALRGEDSYHVRYETCPECHGRTIKRCCMCYGSAVETCKTCSGYGKLKKTSQLHVEWKGKVQCYTSDRSTMSPHFIKRCKDVVVYENTSDAGPLNPITAYDCMHKGVVQASWKFINSHKQTDSSHVVRKQSHSITITPIYKAFCHRGSKQKVYWLAGTDLNVFDPLLINARDVRFFCPLS